MSLQGKVIEVVDNSVIVEVVPSPECQGCHACTSLLDGEKGSKTKQIRALSQGFSLKVGDVVAIALDPGQGSIVAILIFGIPMLAFFAGLGAAPFLCQSLNITLTDFARVVSGFIFMGIAFGALALFSGSKHANGLTMKVQHKVE